MLLINQFYYNNYFYGYIPTYLTLINYAILYMHTRLGTIHTYYKLQLDTI